MRKEGMWNWLESRQALQLLSEPADYAFLDVRAPCEYQQGAIPGFVNEPILSDEERHQVGLCYAEWGQEKAIELGMRLVGEDRINRVARMRALANGRPLLITCWRGGLRSGTACSWLENEPSTLFRVRGGYKAMRRDLMERLESLPPFLLLAGLTGCGKTRLLHALRVPKVDLEAYAEHRGSAFGHFMDRDQPSQATFENRILLALPKEGPVVVEDESAHIGSVSLPPDWVLHSRRQPCVWLEAGRQERIRHIWQEYIANPLRQGVSPEQCRDWLAGRLARIERRLGGQLCKELQAELAAAFATPEDWAAHQWIGRLLETYYDPRYRHAFERSQKTILFRGEYPECLQWIERRYA